MIALVTGFEPFGGEPVNPSWQAVSLLPDEIGGAGIVRACVPVAFGASGREIDRLIALHQPDLILCTGMAGGRAHLSVERVAINCDDARIPDNEGACPADAFIVPDGPAAYFSTLPVRGMVGAMRAAGVPASVSNSAGTYVCNHILYMALHLCATKYPGRRAGFIHVPFGCEQALEKNAPSLPVEVTARGLEAALAAAVGGFPGLL